MLLLALHLAGAGAWAGVLQVDTAVPAEIRMEGATVLRTFGPRVAELDLAAGPATVEIVRDGVHKSVDLTLPVQGTVHLAVKAKGESVDASPVAPANAGVLELHAAAGKTFTLLIDGDRVVVFGAAFPVTLPAVAPGNHLLELRSADQTIVWSSASVTVRAGDHVYVNAAEGRMLEVSGGGSAGAPSTAPLMDGDDSSFPTVNSPDILGK